MSPLTWYRKISQLLFFILTGQWLLTGFLRCPFGVPFVSCANCPLGDCSGRFLFFPVVLLLVGITLLFGRAFCAWMCPLGTLEDAAGLVASSRRVSRSPLGWLARHDRWFKLLKIAMLLVVILALFHGNFTSERPHPYVIRSPELWNWDAIRLSGALGLSRYPWRIAILAGALLGALLIPRFWCRWLCPLGWILGLFNKIAPFRLRRNEAACSSCGRFPKACVHHTIPETTDCIVCGECAAQCPQQAISLRPTPSRDA